MRPMRCRARVAVLIGVIGLVALGVSLGAVESDRPPSVPGTITGQVLAFNPVSGQVGAKATIAVRSHGALVTTIHASSGYFRLRLSSGIYRLRVWFTEIISGNDTRRVEQHCWTNVGRRMSRVRVESDRRANVTLRCGAFPPNDSAG